MKHTHKLSERDLLDGYRLLYAMTAKRVVLLIVLLSLLVFMGFCVGPGLARYIFWCLVFGVSLGVTIWRFQFVREKAKSAYRKTQALRGDQVLELVEEGLRCGDGKAEVLLRWSDMLDYKNNRKIFLIRIPDKRFLIVPKRIRNDGFDIAGLTGKIEGAFQ
ncbi:MAG: YcxB family protein [bacterium]|nr:YcxB family protein [bacterium]